MRDLDFCIPAYNAEETIFDCVFLIHKYIPEGITYNIFVGDNESTDATAFQASQGKNVHVETIKADSVAGVRNQLFELTDAKVVLFLDSDCEITGTWHHNIAQALDGLNHITGSFVTEFKRNIPTMSFMYKNWFILKPTTPSNNYINSGHLIVPSHIFRQLNGFDENLKTGEDYDFCQRALALDIEFEANENLLVMHRGTPTTVYAFFKREMWHGVGDCTNFKAFFTSKISLLATIFMFSIIISMVYIFKGEGILPLLLTMSMPIAFSFFKFPNLKWQQRIKNSYICTVYLIARFFSVFFIYNSKWLYDKK